MRTVAPYVGAWIETIEDLMYVPTDALSHPTWVRGLKRFFGCLSWCCKLVAPYVGAWIETKASSMAPRVKIVAPYVGAWIETPYAIQKEVDYLSHPTWVRGLKHPLLILLR